MDRCSGRRNVTETMLKMALNTIQSIQQCLLPLKAQSLILRNILYVITFNLFWSKILWFRKGLSPCLTLSQTSPGFYLSAGEVF